MGDLAELLDPFLRHLTGPIAGRFETMDGGVGRFAPRGIGARRLAELFGVSAGIEDIVGDLECEADPFAVSAQAGDLALVRAADDRADLAACSDQGSGLPLVNQLQGIGVDRLAFGENIDGLAIDQPRGRLGQHQRASERDGGWERTLEQGLEGGGEESVAGEDGDGLPELDVAGWFSPAEVIVVEGGKIVVYEGECVNQLDGARGVERAVDRPAHGFGRREEHGRPQPLSGTHAGVAHRLVQLSGGPRDGGQDIIQAGVYQVGVGLKARFDSHRSQSTEATFRRQVISPTMAIVRPFFGLRYSAAAGPIQSLTAPPYDVLSPAEREDYAARSPHNIVHLTLPEPRADDRSKFVKYARSAALLTEWRREGVLVPEPQPAFYRYVQTFLIGGETFVRTAIVALIKLEPYANGVVLPHEETFPKHKEDRLRILEATRAHLECIYGLFEDEDAGVLEALKHAPVGSGVTTKSDDGVDHAFEPIIDPSTIEQLTGLLADKKIWIADGHHRYETALAFREALGPQSGPVAEDYMMMAMSSLSDPGLVLLPTHRIVQHWKYNRQTALEALSELFEIHETHSSRLLDQLYEDPSVRTFAVAFEGGLGYILKPKDEAALMARTTGGSSALRELDVTVLHQVIFDQLLGLPPLDNIAYTRDAQEAIREVNEGAAAAFLMRPPTVDDMKTIALGGERMPQKSTYYFPKILSGLVLWSLNDY